ncbi:hypothetical protein ACVWYH_002368 [Bradyrhizobium sp. GM24.11]
MLQRSSLAQYRSQTPSAHLRALDSLEPIVFAVARWVRQAKLRTGVTSARGKTLAISLAESASDCFVSDRALAGTAVGATQGQVYNNPHPTSYLALQTWVFVFNQRWHTRCKPLRNRRLLALCIDMQRGRRAPDGTRASKEADNDQSLEGRHDITETRLGQRFRRQTNSLTHGARERLAEMSCNILIDRCGMIQKPAKLRSVGLAREIARFTPQRRIGNPSVYRKSAASSFETTIERKFV